MNKPMEETFGMVVFWIRIWVLSGLLLWTLIGEIVKQTVLKNVDN